MDAALIELSATLPQLRLDTDRLRDMLLLRLAVSDKALPRDMLARDLGAYTSHIVSGDAWRSHLDRDLAALADAGLADLKSSSAAATEAGVKRAAITFSGRAAFPKSWPEARDTRLIARAIGLDNEAPARLKKLAKPDGLRAAILIKGFGLKLRGTPSPVKLRTALAKLALARAFGNSVETTQERSGISAKAGRALAGRLAATPRDHKTDGRLIAALAADQARADGTDFAALQLALLRRFVTLGGATPQATGKQRRRATVKAKPVHRTVAGTPRLASEASQPGKPAPQPITTERLPGAGGPSVPVRTSDAVAKPTLAAFAADILALSVAVAEGFSGNRKAFISKVWAVVATTRPTWGLSEVEFKCMLTEAHRVGALVLANVDLKDGRRLADIQASAVSYRNAVFHYVRIDT
jgi:hypothetical protein